MSLIITIKYNNFTEYFEKYIVETGTEVIGLTDSNRVP
jgi:hypothetical protein